MRLEIVNTCAEEMYLDKVVYGCYGDEGYLYNIHYHVNPENYNGRLQDWNGTIKNSKYFMATKSYFQTENSIKSAFMLCVVQSRVKWCPNGAYANKQGYELQNEVMKRNE